ncbi:MAG: hypothetical protein AABW58_02355 [Nanoarchaeota archaeon]
MQKKSLSKKAAIELSMTTIIVIIIGITLLSLGLLWVRGTFKDITRLSGDAFKQADGAISDIFEEVDRAVYVSPPSVDLEQGSAKTAQFRITNFEQEQLKAKATVQSSDGKISCLFADTFKAESKEYTLESGKTVEIKVIVEDKGSSLGIKGCNFDVPSVKNSNSDSLIVAVVKKQGVFG